MRDVQQTWPDDLARLYREKGYWRGETMFGFLRQRADEAPDAVAVVGGGERWTYAELVRRAEDEAARFTALGLRAGDRVLVQLPNVPEFLSVVFGLFRAGLVPVFALPAHRLTEIAHLAERSEAKGYVVVAMHDGFDYRSLSRDVAAQVGSVRHVVVVGDAAETDGPRTADPAPPHAAAPSSVAFLQISGGSTGLPKLIPRTHDDYIYSFRASVEICGLDRHSVFMAVLPIAHNFPMSSPGVFGTLYAGGRIVLCPSPDPETAFSLIAAERVTITGVVPPLALLWLQAAPATRRDLSSLRVLLVGGAKFTPEAASRVRDTLGCQLQQVFGMAEGLVNYTRLDDPDERAIETQGRPISPDDEVRIVDPEGRPVPDGAPGLLLTRGPYTIRAYHNDPEANLRAFTPDGFYRTGDVVVRRPDGYLVVQGRVGDHINRAGEKVSAEEIEDHLIAHPSVFDAAVVSVPDPFLGERSCAFVVAVGRRPGIQELKRFIRDRGLAEFKVPDQVVFVDAFQTTAVGKVSRTVLRGRLRADVLPHRS